MYVKSLIITSPRHYLYILIEKKYSLLSNDCQACFRLWEDQELVFLLGFDIYLLLDLNLFDCSHQIYHKAA